MQESTYRQSFEIQFANDVIKVAIVMQLAFHPITSYLEASEETGYDISENWSALMTFQEQGNDTKS